ncbi:MAG TPA: adenylate kinase [Ktedonobacterales bacterium]|nr:adenylate kinase [Ktedonobacterales bacterium]
MDILLLGAQGSGKGTQADILAAKLGIPHVASGDLLRSAISNHTPAGQKARPYYDRGDLVPDEIMIAMFLERLAEADCARGVILDGFPRTVVQADALDKALVPMGRGVDHAIYLKADPAVLVKRLANRYICRANQHPYNLVTNPPKRPGICDIDGSELYQRSDDTEEAVRRRLEIFYTETVRLLAYYGEQKKVREVDAEQPIPDVTRDILRALAV